MFLQNMKHRFLRRLDIYIGIVCCLVIFAPQSWSQCATENVTDCTYTVRCMKVMSSASLPSCSKSPNVTLLITGTNKSIITLSFFSSTNFDSRVRVLIATNNNWTSLENNAMGYYKYTTLLDLSRNNIQVIRDDTFSSLTTLRLLNISRNYLTNFTSRTFYTGTTSTLSSLDLSHNRISHISSETLKYHKQLQSLDLSDNLIVSLDDNCFAGLDRLQSINFTNNILDSFNVTLLGLKTVRFLSASRNRFRKLDAYELRRLLSIEVLDFSHNFLISIDDDLFNPFQKLEVVDLSYNHIVGQLTRNTFKNNPKLTKVNVFGNKYFHIEDNAFANTSLQEFNFTNNEFSGDIREFTFNGLEHVFKLDMSNQSITALRAKAFSNMKDLTYLNFSRNFIEIIESECFGSLSLLLKLDLSHNRLKTVNIVHFKGMSKLQNLYLQFNNLTGVSENALSGLSSLETLDLTHNKILAIDPFSLPVNTLKSLLIKNNEISGDIKINVFSPAPFLKEFDISESYVFKISNESFSNMLLIEQLNISYNEINFIELNSFINLPNILTLDLSHNNLSEMYFNKQGISNLRSLYASHNKIDSLTNKIFEQLYNLKHVDLSHNKIMHISENIFDHLAQLRTLILANNAMRTFHGVYNKFSKLVNLDLSANKIINLNLSFFNELVNCDLSDNAIASVDNRFFTELSKNISHLDLSQNQITSLKPGVMGGFSLLRYFNMSHNHIMDLRYGSFRGLVNLETFDISYNNLSALDVHIFHECPRLNSLVIDNNFITSIDIGRLREVVSSLKRLSIGGNPVSCEEVIGHIRNVNKSVSLEIESVDKVYHEDNVNGIQCGVSLPKSTTSEYNNDKGDGNVQTSALLGVTLLWCSVITVFIGIIFVAMYYFRRNLLLIYGASRFQDRSNSLELESS